MVLQVLQWALACNKLPLDTAVHKNSDCSLLSAKQAQAIVSVTTYRSQSAGKQSLGKPAGHRCSMSDQQFMENWIRFCVASRLGHHNGERSAHHCEPAVLDLLQLVCLKCLHMQDTRVRTHGKPIYALAYEFEIGRLTFESFVKPRGSNAPPGYFLFSGSDSPFRRASEPAMATNSCNAGPRYEPCMPHSKCRLQAIGMDTYDSDQGVDVEWQGYPQICRAAALDCLQVQTTPQHHFDKQLFC